MGIPTRKAAEKNQNNQGQDPASYSKLKGPSRASSTLKSRVATKSSSALRVEKNGTECRSTLWPSPNLGLEDALD